MLKKVYAKYIPEERFRKILRRHGRTQEEVGSPDGRFLVFETGKGERLKRVESMTGVVLDFGFLEKK